jgi:GGDEF domain-containing protein
VLIQLEGAPDVAVAAAEARLLRAIRPGDLVGRLADDRLAVLAETSGGRAAGKRVTDSLATRIAARLGEPFHWAVRRCCSARPWAWPTPRAALTPPPGSWRAEDRFQPPRQGGAQPDR